jgi:hypothetical protein
VIIAAAVCPWPPLLVRELTGEQAVLPELRDACLAAAGRLLAAEPDVVAVVGPSATTKAWHPGGRLDRSIFAPALPGGGTSSLPPSLGIGAMLLDCAGYRGPRFLHAVADDEPPVSCGRLGEQLAASGQRTALLVMGDGSARRSVRAPGYLDERAHAFDAGVERAMRAGDLDALRDIDADLARELMATGRPGWQVLAGAMNGITPASDVLYAGDPFGVAYLVATFTQ